jgi:hypothetical protein
MRQFLRKSALAVVLSAVALCGTAQQATAQVTVTPNGVGDLLIFGYWTSFERDTLVSITNAFGGQASRYVHLRVKEGVNSADIANFTICLSQGDVWTAAITSDSANAGGSTLVIGDPGSCDAGVNAGFGLTAPPGAGQPLPLSSDFGYIEAYTLECNAASPGCPGVGIAPRANNNGGDDVIMGTATLVSASAGFSSSYNATSLVGFNAFNEGASIANASGSGTAGNQGARANIANAIANESSVNKQILMGRWTANNSFDSSTDIVLTFPTGGQPRGGATGLVPDPVSVWIFDEEENSTFSPRSMILRNEVNICRFRNANETGGKTRFICNDSPADSIGGTGNINGPGSTGTFNSGSFRIINNNDMVAPLVDNDGQGTDATGAESDNVNATPDSAFPVIGLLFSFFRANNVIFDQAYGIQWTAIYGQGGIGGALCNVAPGRLTPTVGVNFPPLGGAGCNSYDISSSYLPGCFAGNPGSCTPQNDNTTGNANASVGSSS